MPTSRAPACAWCRPAVARRGAYIAPNVVLMPSYVNIGAYVDSGTMVDTWATVGSCAQIGRNVHLSGGVGIGGVLEPLQANPTIIEDNCFIGARSEVVEGVIVEENSVLGMGVFLGQSTKIYNRMTDEVSYGRIPSGSVVVAGSLPSGEGKCHLYCAVIVKRVDAGTRVQDQHQRAAARLSAMRGMDTMSVSIKTDDEIAGMRVAGRLASELLDFLTPARAAGGVDRRDRSHRARLPGQRAARDSGDTQLRAARTSAVPGVAVRVGEPRRLPRHTRGQEAQAG